MHVCVYFSFIYSLIYLLVLFVYLMHLVIYVLVYLLMYLLIYLCNDFLIVLFIYHMDDVSSAIRIYTWICFVLCCLTLTMRKSYAVNSWGICCFPTILAKQIKIDSLPVQGCQGWHLMCHWHFWPALFSFGRRFRWAISSKKNLQ